MVIDNLITNNFMSLLLNQLNKISDDISKLKDEKKPLLSLFCGRDISTDDIRRIDLVQVYFSELKELEILFEKTVNQINNSKLKNIVETLASNDIDLIKKVIKQHLFQYTNTNFQDTVLTDLNDSIYRLSSISKMLDEESSFMPEEQKNSIQKFIEYITNIKNNIDHDFADFDKEIRESILLHIDVSA